MTEPYKAVQTGEGTYGVVRVDTGVVVNDGLPTMTEAVLKEIQLNELVKSAGEPKRCAVHDSVFYGPGRLCDGYHSKAEIRDAYGATNDEDI